jgi:hypothetical protein
MRFIAAILIFTSAALMAQVPNDKVSLDPLIHNIEEVSSLVISRHDPPAWSHLELESILEVLLLLPEEMRFQQRIVLRKKGSIFILGISNKNLIDTSLLKREMWIKNFSAGDVFTEDPELYQRSYFKRAFLLNLALLFYDSLPREQKDKWRAFSLWTRGLFSPDRPSSINPDGFAGDSGRRSAALDFANFACEFFVPPGYKDPMSYVKFRLPDRYAFFRDLFESKPDPLKDHADAQSFRDWVDPEDVEHIEILVTTPTSSSPASIAGHALMLIKRKQDFYDGRDSLVLGFVGETSLDKRNGVDSLIYAYRGITGYYSSLIQEENLEGLVQRATILENRDVQRFRLILTEEEATRLIERLWVIKHAFTYQYKFFRQNCVSMLLDTLNHVFPPEEKIELNVPMVAPMHVIARLRQQKRLGDFIYPEYWSIGSKARYASQKNQAIQRRILAFVHGKASRYSTFDKELLAEIEDLFSILFSEGSAQLRSDSLFREPILDIDNKGRDLAYERMASLWMSLYSKYVENEGIITQEEYSELVELLIRFLLNANDRELYIAIPADIKENYPKSDPIPADVSREYLEQQLRKVQLRQRNSKEIQSLRWAISALRDFADSRFPNPEMYIIGRDLQQELAGELAAKRENIAFTHGYYPTFLHAAYRNIEYAPYAVLGLESAVFFEELGHSSIFALKKDMKLVLLCGGFDGWFGLAENPFVLGAGRSLLTGHGTVFAFKKIFTGNDIDYSGFFNHGFGVTLLDSRSILWDGETLFPNRDSKTKVIEAQYILNIFEIDEFRWYLDLETGAGYVFEKIDGVPAHYLGLSLALEGKLYTGGNFDNALRFSFAYEPFLDFTSTFISNIRASAELGFGLGKYSNTIFYMGTNFDLRLLHQSGNTIMGIPELNCHLRLKFD